MNQLRVSKFGRLRLPLIVLLFAISVLLLFSMMLVGGSNVTPAQAQGPTPTPSKGIPTNPPPVSYSGKDQPRAGIPSGTTPRLGKTPKVVAATWVAQGGSIINGQVEGMTAQSNPVVGAVTRIVPHPSNADIVWIATTNGGIWKTTNATNTSPTWTPLTDQQASLSIGALELDPNDGTNQTLVAGFGRLSSFGSEGGTLNGMLRTTNGGTNWSAIGTTDLANQNIVAAAVRGSTILAATNGGLFLSTNTGANFTIISGSAGTGLPAGQVFDLVGDSGTLTRFYAAVAGNGIFLSTNSGATWTAAGGTTFNGASGDVITGARNIKIAVPNTGGATNVVYAGIVGSTGRLTAWFRSANQGGTWAALDIPSPTIHPGGQGGIHFALVADPTNANIVYVSGDRQDTLANNFPNAMGANNYTGNIFRCDASLGAGTQCTTETHSGTASNSAPHADSRKLVFDSAGNILEGDDGGIYRRTSTQNATGDWSSLTGNLQNTESTNCAYDSIARIIICGNQDNGVGEQSTTGSSTWRTVTQGDGGIVAVDNSNASSLRYFSSQNFGGFRRRTCNASNSCTNAIVGLVVNGSGGQTLTKTFDPTVQFLQPFELNKINPSRIIVGTNRLYESSDQGETLNNLGDTGAAISALAYGGKSGGVNNPDVLYYGNGNGMFLRTTAGGIGTQLTNYAGGVPTDIVLDPNDWNTAYVIDGTRVWRTTNAGAAWTEITGNLGTFAAGTLRTIEFLPRLGTNNAILVGTDIGVFLTPTPSAGTWDMLGSNLPRVLVFDLRYNSGANVLLAATLGRSAWTINNASCLGVTCIPLYLPLIVR